MKVRVVESAAPILKSNAGDIIIQTPIIDKRESKESEYIQDKKEVLLNQEQCK